MTLLVLVWFLNPLLGLVCFLVLSAYHFGQSQFTKYSSISQYKAKSLYLTWGVAVTSGLCLFNNQEILNLGASTHDLSDTLPLFQADLFTWLFLISSSLFIVIILSIVPEIGLHLMLLECLIFGLIVLSLYVHSLLIGFSIYFATLHSWKVLGQEFQFLYYLNYFLRNQPIGFRSPLVIENLPLADLSLYVPLVLPFIFCCITSTVVSPILATIATCPYFESGKQTKSPT